MTVAVLATAAVALAAGSSAFDPSETAQERTRKAAFAEEAAAALRIAQARRAADEAELHRLQQAAHRGGRGASKPFPISALLGGVHAVLRATLPVLIAGAGEDEAVDRLASLTLPGLGGPPQPIFAALFALLLWGDESALQRLWDFPLAAARIRELLGE